MENQLFLQDEEEQKIRQIENVASYCHQAANALTTGNEDECNKHLEKAEQVIRQIQRLARQSPHQYNRQTPSFINK